MFVVSDSGTVKYYFCVETVADFFWQTCNFCMPCDCYQIYASFS